MCKIKNSKNGYHFHFVVNKTRSVSVSKHGRQQRNDREINMGYRFILLINQCAKLTFNDMVRINNDELVVCFQTDVVIRCQRAKFVMGFRNCWYLATMKAIYVTSSTHKMAAECVNL